MDYANLTKQKSHSVYSARWGCAATCLINIAEITRLQPCTDREVDSIYGNWDRSGHVTICNYEQVGPGWIGIRNEDLPFKQRWNEKNDQMSHCLIQNWSKALRDVFWSLEMDFNLYKTSRFEIVEFSGPRIPSHFCLYYNGRLINPDEAIDIGNLSVKNRFRI